MSDADNPYRFVEAVEQEESADAPRPAVESTYDGWDLRSYVAPQDEPIYSPAEIAELGKRWSGIALTTSVDLVILAVLGFLLLPDWRPLTQIAGNRVMGAVVTLAVLLLQSLIAREAYLLARALRYSRPLASLAAVAYALPVTNLALLLSMSLEAVATLKRHGIRIGLIGPSEDDLPRRTDSAKGADR